MNINIHIDINMNIDIHIINMNSIFGGGGPLPGPQGARRNRYGTATTGSPMGVCTLHQKEQSEQ